LDSQTDSLPTTDSTAEELKAEIAEKQSLLDNLKEKLQVNKLHPDDTKFLLDLMNQDDHDHWDRSEPKAKNFKAKVRARKKMATASQRRNRGL
jgi:hypothetical protein